MNGVLWAFMGTVFTFLITSLGAVNVFWIRGKVRGDIQCIFLGFAGGVMIAASMWSLLIPAIEEAEAKGQISWIPSTGGFLLGVLLLLFLDNTLKRFEKRREAQHRMSDEKRRAAMLILAITIHNIPEGMAVGLAFAMAAANPDNAGLFTGAAALALGIGIQNYPEGAAVALPLRQEGMKPGKAFCMGSMSAIVEPVFGVLAAALAGIVSPVMPWLLSFAAGTMIYVVVEELIPEAHMGEKDNIGTLGFVVGFLVMMILDVAL